MCTDSPLSTFNIVIAIIMLFAVWTVMLLFLVQSVPVVGLKCSDGALSRAQCSSVSMVRCELKYISFIIAIIILLLLLYYSIFNV